MEQVAILDAGAQFGKVIDRKVRELYVKSEILPIDTPAFKLEEYDAIIISGGPQSVYDEDAPKCDPELLNLNIPVLGICWGMQYMNHKLGGNVEKKDQREDGCSDIYVKDDSSLFAGLNSDQTVLMSHGDSITKLADGFEATAFSGDLVAAIENRDKGLYGVQFHPEVDLTTHGKHMLHNFLYGVAGLTGSYTIEDRAAKAIKFIQDTVGDKKVLTLVSGGVDSTVCTALLNKALGPEKVYPIHVDNGFMRLNESNEVKEALEGIGLELRVVNAAEEYYSATTVIDGVETKPLNETVSPEEKRKIIGNYFMTLSDAEVHRLGLDWKEVFLAQGTLRPDLIESGSHLASSNADVIKSHHNDTKLAREKRKAGQLIEPLTEYHKDEVRQLGESLGLPEEIVWRQPFPGPGLAIRILCAEEPYITKDFDRINERLAKFSTRDLSATLLPIQTVGVQGDGRTYNYAAVISGDGSWEERFRLASEIPKSIHQINRVVYAFGKKIEGTLTRITPTHLTPPVIKQLQQADDIVNEVLSEFDLLKDLSQVPVVSFPVNFGYAGYRSIAIRPFITNDFMTGVSAIPGKDIPEEALKEMRLRIMTKVPGIIRIVYDLTSKPPGTTEWE